MYYNSRHYLFDPIQQSAVRRESQFIFLDRALKCYSQSRVCLHIYSHLQCWENCLDKFLYAMKHDVPTFERLLLSGICEKKSANIVILHQKDILITEENFFETFSKATRRYVYKQLQQLPEKSGGWNLYTYTYPIYIIIG